MKRALRWVQVISLGWLLGLASVRAAGPVSWSEKDTRLATEYLNLLVQKPEYGRVLDLLWDLYDRKQATGFLLDSIANQAKAQPHPNVLLVHAHLLRKAGRTDEARRAYEAVLEKDSTSYIALRALADLALEQGDKEKALDLFDKILRSLPADDASRAALLVEKGRLAEELNKLDIAGAAWEDALRARPNDAAFAREIAQLMVGAGLTEKALTVYRSLARDSDPVKRLDALFDLSRLEEQADHFENAAKALRDGLALLHFKDWHYEEFFRRLVKLHERYGQLEALKADLLKKAETPPPQERALMDMARYSDLVVDLDEHVKWMRELVKYFPAEQEYRWALVRDLLDRENQAEAGQLLDEKLKDDATDNAALVLLRCEVHLRAGETERAVLRVEKLLAAQGANPDVEKAIYQFATAHALDGVLEKVLRTRLDREPDKVEAVFELAGFLMKRQRSAEVEGVFGNWLGRLSEGSSEERRHRLRDIANFYTSAQDANLAEQYARRAADAKDAGRDDLLQLADAETQHGGGGDTLALLERAWKLSDSPEKRTDVDERILALLSGDTAPHTSPPPSASTEFRLPALFTGEGFGSDAPAADKPPAVADAVRSYALARAVEARPGWWSSIPPVAGIFLPWHWTERMILTMADGIPTASEEQTLRAAWWCLRANETDLALSLARRLIFDNKGHRISPSLEAEKLVLEIAQDDKNPFLVMQQLRRLSQMDPDNRTSYERRLAEQYLEISANSAAPRTDEERMEVKISTGWLRERATGILEQLARDDPANESVLSALAQCYAVTGRRDVTTALWERAVRVAKGNATPLLEHYAESLIGQHKFQEFVGTQMRLLEDEADLKKRREIFSRALERLMWADSLRGELTDDDKKTRLDLLAASVKSQSQRHPFDGFWFEALARIYGRQDNNAKAFEAMKQAYYTAPDTPFSLDQLRAAALDAGDLKSAIYFQKQIAASAAAKDEAGEWRALVQLLEQDFRQTEADQVRRRLEARFSQDAASLEDLVKYYQDTAQDESARRVLEQIARVQSWRPAALLRLALAQERIGENVAAEKTLRQMLATPFPENGASNVPPERLSWPLFDTHSDKAAKHEDMLEVLDNAPGLEPAERQRMRVFLSLPRPEDTILPDEPAPARLRAVEELARLHPQAIDAKLMDALHLSEMERAWAFYHSGHGAEFRTLLARHLADSAELEGRFVMVWLGIKSHGVADVAAWVRAAKGDELMDQRKNLLHLVTSILVEDEEFQFTDADFVALGASRLLANTELVDLARKLESHQRHHQALLVGQAAQANAPSLEAEYGAFLSRIAEAAGDTEAERRFLRNAWEHPLEAEQPASFDPFLQSFAKLLRLAPTATDRQHLILETWRRLNKAPPSGQNVMRKARVLGLIGADEVAAKKLADYFGNGFLTARAFVEPLMGKLNPAALSGPRIDELNHMREYWGDLHEWDDVLRQDGLAQLLGPVEERVFMRNGGTPLGPRANYEFTSWRNQMLVRRMRMVSYPERLRLLAERVAEDDSVEVLGETGKFLETQGLARECIELYRQLPDRAPSNTEYCEQFLRVSEIAWDYDAAIPYLEKLFVAEPQFRPQNIPEGFPEEKHAEFLARLHDTAQLRALAFRPAPLVKTNRVPEEVPYLRELAPLLEREGDKPGALAAWEQLASIFPQDVDAAVRRAQILAGQGQQGRALEALRNMPPGGNLWNESVLQGLVLRAKLAAEAGLWDEMREIMNLVADGAAKPGTAPQVNVPGVVAISGVLAEHQRMADAQSLLVRAERAVKEDAQRFILRMEELRLSAQDPGWDPQRDASRIAALLRTPVDQENALKTFADWLAAESRSPRSAAWFEVLKQQSVPGPNTVLALAALGRAGDVNGGVVTNVRWVGEGALMGVPRRFVVRLLLEHHQPALARTLIPSDDPLLVPVLAALGDEVGMSELFGRLVRDSFPGGLDAVDYAEALARNGHANLAEELYGLAVERLRATGGVLPALIKSNARFLVMHRHFEQAEALLMRDGQGLTDGLPEILVELYRGWNKLDRLDAEMVKFHLPGGVRAEALFLARSTLPHS